MHRNGTDAERAAEVAGDLEGLVDSVGMILWELTPERDRFRYISASAERKLGHPRDRWLDEDHFLERCLHADDRADTLDILDNVVADGEPQTTTIRLRAADGRWIRFRTEVRRHRRDGSLSLAGTMLDVSEEHATQSKLDYLLEHTPVILFVLDRDGVITFSSGLALKGLGLKSGDVVGRSAFDIYPDEPWLQDELRRAIAGDAFVGGGRELAGHYFQTHYAPLHDPQGELVGCVGVSVDITERRQAELARDDLLERERVAHKRAQEAVRIRDEFLSIASHELKTPLTSLQLAIQSVLYFSRRDRLDVSDRPLLAKVFSTTERQVKRLGRLVDSLLDASSIAAGRLRLDIEEASLNSIVREVLSHFTDDLARAGCTTQFVATNEVNGRWDRARLEQVVTNLLSNALKYGAKQPIDIVLEKTGRTARLIVTDRGIGIPEEMHARIFERFERGPSTTNVGGLGLGLYIVSRIVAAHGGTVSVESRVGEGSTFTVELPRGLT